MAGPRSPTPCPPLALQAGPEHVTWFLELTELLGERHEDLPTPATLLGQQGSPLLTASLTLAK